MANEQGKCDQLNPPLLLLLLLLIARFIAGPLSATYSCMPA